MDFKTIMQERYTTKKYNPAKKVSEDKIEDLKEILRLSPSSINSQPWKFLFIENPELKARLAEVSFHNKSKILEASNLVVFTVFKSKADFEKQMESYMAEGSVDYYNKHLKNIDEQEIVNWMRHQVYISLGVFLAAAAGMGIDATPMEGIDNKEYNKILNLDGTHAIFAAALGYRADDDFNQLALKPKTRKAAGDVIEVI